MNKPENERRKVKLFSQQVSSRSREHKESQKHPQKSKGLMFRVQDKRLVGKKEQWNISLLSDSASSEEELEVLHQPTNAIPIENSLFYQQHYKNINSLLTKYLPGGRKSFRYYLTNLFITSGVTNLKDD